MSAPPSGSASWASGVARPPRTAVEDLELADAEGALERAELRLAVAADNAA